MNQKHQSINPNDLQLKVGMVAVAKHNYDSKGIKMSTGITDVDLRKGDQVLIKELCPNSWVNIIFVFTHEDQKEIKVYPIENRKGGVVPMSFLEGEDDDETGSTVSSKSNSDSHTEIATGLWDYNSSGTTMSSGDVDISFKKGDIMRILETCPNSWLKVQHLSTGEVGVIPSSYVVRSDLSQNDSPPESAESFEMSPVLQSSFSEENMSYGGALKRSVGISPQDDRRRSKSLNQTILSNLYSNVNKERNKLEEVMEKIVDRGREEGNGWSFSSPDTKENIIFDDRKMSSEIEQEKPIKAATLEKLVEHLTFPKFVDPVYAVDFLLTYRSFCTPEQLLNLLIERFDVPEPLNMDNSEKEVYQNGVVKPIRLRVFNVIKMWVENYWNDFRDKETDMLSSLTSFAGIRMKGAGMEQASATLLKIIQKKTESQIDEPIEEPIVNSTPKDDKLQKMLFVGKFLDTSSRDIAEQLTIIDFELFKKITPQEFLGQPWSKKARHHRAPNLMRVIGRFNNVSQALVGWTIVHEEIVSVRTELICKFIDIMEALNELKSFNTLLSILLGLRTAHVGRLKKSWAGVPELKMKIFNDFLEVFAPEGSHLNLRQVLKKTRSTHACIPYLGIYLSDLTVIEEIHKDIDERMVNFEKCTRIASVIKEVQAFQSEPYVLKQNQILSFFLNDRCELVVDEDECYKASLVIEPPTPKEPKKPLDSKSDKKKKKETVFGTVLGGKEKKRKSLKDLAKEGGRSVLSASVEDLAKPKTSQLNRSQSTIFHNPLIPALAMQKSLKSSQSQQRESPKIESKGKDSQPSSPRQGEWRSGAISPTNGSTPAQSPRLRSSAFMDRQDDTRVSIGGVRSPSRVNSVDDLQTLENNRLAALSISEQVANEITNNMGEETEDVITENVFDAECESSEDEQDEMFLALIAEEKRKEKGKNLSPRILPRTGTITEGKPL
eukprot:TRINITY_DN3510_c0_g1_i1.p1 TRINITY_DN3510_c0_g1~~TRINITY_DN3510_c0_g1_i1.p1  ORF type:complete len:948 (+),score=371.20 TRINITY_DN3510_c0_g1_i1:310-3153(+)